MYDYLFDVADQDPIRPNHPSRSAAERSDSGVFMTRYQKERQRVYDRARHMVQDLQGHPHRETEDAKAEAGLVRNRARISRAQGDELAWVKSMLRTNTAARRGYRTPVDMVAALADVPRPDARELVYLAERLPDSEIGRIQDGEISYSRMLAETRLVEAGASAEDIAASRDLDLDGVQKMLAEHNKTTRTDERRIFEEQYVALQPSLDGTHMRVMGRIGSYEGELCRQALNQLGDRLVPTSETRPDPGQRRALALTALCQDQLDQSLQRSSSSGTVSSTDSDSPPSGSRREPLLMVVANNPLAEDSGYEQGTSILAGGRVGPDTVGLIACGGRTEHITVSDQHIVHHRTTRTVKPSTRRAVLARDGGCTIDSCTSPYRLEVHHIIPLSQGGDHTPHNLTTLCWWHHHVAVHRRGMRIDPTSPPRRRRLLPPQARCGHQPPQPDPHTIELLRYLHHTTNRAPP